MVVLPVKSQAAESLAGSFPECQAKKTNKKSFSFGNGASINFNMIGKI